MLQLEDDYKVSFVFEKNGEEESNEKELMISAPLLLAVHYVIPTLSKPNFRIYAKNTKKSRRQV